MGRKIEAVPFILLTFVLIMGLFITACSNSGDESALDGKRLLEDRCTECHTLSRVKSAEKTRVQWERTVDRMISLGAELNADERGVLLDYLEATYSN